MKAKLQISGGTVYQLNRKWSWKVYVSEPKKDFASCIVTPGFIKEFENECIGDMDKVCKKLGLKFKKERN